MSRKCFHFHPLCHHILFLQFRKSAAAEWGAEEERGLLHQVRHLPDPGEVENHHLQKPLQESVSDSKSRIVMSEKCPSSTHLHVSSFQQRKLPVCLQMPSHLLPVLLQCVLGGKVTHLMCGRWHKWAWHVSGRCGTSVGHPWFGWHMCVGDLIMALT